MKLVFERKLIMPLLLVCLGLGFVYQDHKSNGDTLSHQYHQINIAAETLDLEALTKLSSVSKSNFQRAYIEYRLALTAEKASRPSEMEAALERSLQLLEALNQQATNAESYALTAAIHLKRLTYSKEPKPHRAALDRALILGHELEPENPTILLVAAEAMGQTPDLSTSQTAMAELLRHEAGVQLDRLCSSGCPRKESAYVWQGLVDSLENKSWSSKSMLLAKANCSLDFAASGS